MSKKKIVLLNYGRAEPRKGIDLLLDAVKLLVDAGYDVKLYLASPVYYLQRFDILAKYEDLDLFTSVHIIHKINKLQINKLIELSDLFVMPSKDYETFGLTIVEVMNSGLPVIGTPTGAIPEILSKVDTNLVAKKVSSKEIAKSISWFCTLNAKQRLELSKKCRQVVNDYYSKHAIQKKLTDLYDQVLNEK